MFINRKVFVVFLLLFANMFMFLKEAHAEDVPLMIIRFNNKAVMYEQPLQRAVEVAKDTKQDVFFDIVAISPETRSARENKAWHQDAEFYAGKIADQMQQAGIGKDMIRTTFQQNKYLKNNEIRIFVQ